MKPLFTVRRSKDGRYEAAFSMPDFVGLASVVTGLLASNGISIESGEIRTEGGRADIVFRLTSARRPRWRAIETELRRFRRDIRNNRAEKLRGEVNARLMEYFRSRRMTDTAKFHPIDLRIAKGVSRSETVIDIEARDTPAFLFQVTNALALVGINIARLEIRTERGVVRDRFWLTGEGGRPIASPSKLRALRWAILLMKQFTHLLPGVPDPASALAQVAQFGKTIFERKDFDTILLTLKKSDTLEALSRVLGSSLYLWEELIRYQHGSLLGLLGDQKLLKGRKPKDAMRRELRAALEDARGIAAETNALNAFKDREIFRIDLRHLLGMTSYVQEFAEEFTDLGEVIVDSAHNLAWKETLKRMGRPRISPGRASEDAVLALGKFGGRELGYASDLELLFIYSDDASRSGERRSANLRFYTELVNVFKSIIRAKHEGVFEIDLRLRPYGSAGPLAVSLRQFRAYYAPTGAARNFERQALIKLRAVAGSATLGRKAVQWRDRYVYGPKPFDFGEAHELRERQKTELVQKGRVNAKYGTGGLLDTEYAVQMLQIIRGRGRKSGMRNPNTLRALDALRAERFLSAERHRAIRESYVYLRDLINALRIFRGNALDLHVPDEGSAEFGVLARRMGYEGTDEEVTGAFRKDIHRVLDRAASVYASIATELKEEEAFLRRLEAGGPETVDPGEFTARPQSARALGALVRYGFRDAHAALARLGRMRPPRELLARWWPAWEKAADPDLALEHLEAFYRLRRSALWDDFAVSEKSLTVLLELFGSSRYLAGILLAHPQYWSWVREAPQISLESVRGSIQRESKRDLSIEELRRVRHRETLKIALAETQGGAPLEEVFGATTELAEFVLGRVFEIAFGRKRFCIVGMGKLGGAELNYSSDVDLIFILGNEKNTLDIIARMQRFLRLVREGGPSDFLYRVDLRLRSGGNLGSYFLPVQAFVEYYQRRAAVWEYQALIKARPVAGDFNVGETALRRVRPLVYRARWRPNDLKRLREVKHRYESAIRARGEDDTNVKMGRGGMRDIEFTVQMLQLLHGREVPALQSPNTFRALDALERAGILDESVSHLLRQSYLFLRRIENRLQLYENRQTFNLPPDVARRNALGRALGMADGSGQAPGARLEEALARIKSECREVFEKVFYGR